MLLRQTAIGVNFLDIYHRSGLYPWAVPPMGSWGEDAAARRHDLAVCQTLVPMEAVPHDQTLMAEVNRLGNIRWHPVEGEKSATTADR
ncbi:MAG: hypothetical protein ACOH2H_12950 [Cypionkella sp.]